MRGVSVENPTDQVLATCVAESFTTRPTWSHAEAVKHFVMCEVACLLLNDVTATHIDRVSEDLYRRTG